MSDWSNQYGFVKQLIEDPDSFTESIEEPVSKRIRISDDERKEIIKSTLTDSRFDEYLTPVQIAQLIDLIFEEKNYIGYEYTHTKYSIIARYNHFLKPKHEKELKDKIQELKKRKMTKVAMCSELNIGISLLNKYY